jgi:DNA polymerase-3 subunit chi
MTKVDFYTGVDDKLRTACHLSYKAMQSGLRVLLHTSDEATTEALDKLLWQYPVTAFMPHCRNDEVAAAEMPVVVDHRGENFPHNEVLISLHTVCLPFFSRFERVLEIVSQDAEDACLGRERFSYYRDRGYEMRHFDLSKQAEY